MEICVEAVVAAVVSESYGRKFIYISVHLSHDNAVSAPSGSDNVANRSASASSSSSSRHQLLRLRTTRSLD